MSSLRGMFKKVKGVKNPSVDVDTTIDTNVATSSKRDSGTGQLEKLVNKGGTVNVDNSVVNINILFDGKNDSEKQEQVRELLDMFREHGVMLVDKKSAGEVAEYNDYAKNSRDRSLIDFFRNRIPDLDLQVLKTGLYIRYLTEQQEFEKVKRIRANAVRANGRAQNIINLVSEGYFESYIKPIFEEADGWDVLEHYNEVVTYLPEMVFVNNEMSIMDIVDKVESKISQRERYHAVEVRRIMVNGIGIQCVQNIMGAQLELSKRYPGYNYTFSDPHMGVMRRCRLEILLNS